MTLRGAWRCLSLAKKRNSALVNKLDIQGRAPGVGHDCFGKNFPGTGVVDRGTANHWWGRLGQGGCGRASSKDVRVRNREKKRSRKRTRGQGGRARALILTGVTSGRGCPRGAPSDTRPPAVGLSGRAVLRGGHESRARGEEGKLIRRQATGTRKRAWSEITVRLGAFADAEMKAGSSRTAPMRTK